jgi:hypothetical protein
VSIQINVTTLEQLGEQFTSLFKRRAFRLEALDYYDADNETVPFAQFAAGLEVNPAWREPWKKLVREVRASGRTMERVQVVDNPVNDYIRFSLLHGKPASVEAGEDVRVIERWRADSRGLLGYDFWLFDDDLAALLDYNAVGRVLNVRMTDDSLLLPHLRDTRNEALRRSIPLARYVAKYNITGRKHAA